MDHFFDKKGTLEMRWRGVLASTTLLIGSVFLISVLNACDAARILWWNKAGIDDYKKFPNAVVSTAPSSNRGAFSFVESENRSVPAVVVDNKNEPQLLKTLLDQTQSVAWLVLHHDTLVSEYYCDGKSQQSLLTSFSVAKSFVATLVGIAVDEGYISSVDQPVTDFLPNLIDEGFRNVTLRHLLNMRAGLDFSEGYDSPFSPMPRLYYGRQVSKQIENLRIAEPSNGRYQYQSASTQLLSMCLEQAIHRSVAQYLSEKIWQPLSMESAALWSQASDRDTTIKSFCCLNAVGRDYLRFGRLWLNHGRWDSVQIVPEWFVAETLADTLDSKDSRGYAYSHHWRIMPDGALFAKGVLGQNLWVNSNLDLVIVRFGKTDADLDWAKIFRLVERYYSP